MSASYLIFFVFVFFYPLFMAVYWMTGAIIFFRRRESRNKKLPDLDAYPKVSILVPCHNEEKCIHDAIMQLSENHYPNFDIIAIDDGSVDETSRILHELSKQEKRLKIITLTENYGKAMALNAGVLASDAEYVMCIDADALLDKNALFWMIKHFQDSPRVGAVTGNPRVINKTSLLSRIQIGEFSAIVGMVKRTQRNIGRIFTVSGVNTCFRKSALHDVGYWSAETVTEDIDISWKLQFRYWDIRYEPHALTWILVPETLRSLWKQRLRWAQGGFEAATKFAKQMFQWKNRRMWLIGLEYWVSVLWCYAVAFTILCFGLTYALPEQVWPEALRVKSLIPGWTGVALATVCLLQFMVGLVLDSLYERRGQFRYIFWAIWYPAIYWAISAATTVAAVPKALAKRGKTRHARWVSPKRYLKYAPLRGHLPQKKTENRQAFWMIIPKSQRMAELVIMTISWSLWAYLVLPLMSLVVWYFGSVLFKETMLTPGGIATISEIARYGSVIFSMWLCLAIWIIWNKVRYSDMRDRRKTKAPIVSDQQLMERTGLDQFSLIALRECKEMCLHFDNNDKPVIDESVAKLHSRRTA